MCSHLSQSVVWSPWQLLKQPSHTENYALVVLNQGIKFRQHEAVSLLANLWTKAKIRVTVDGGTDRWLKWRNDNELHSLPDPDLVTGDMDSISAETLEYFQKNSSAKVIFTPDVNETDFTKGLRELGKACSSYDEALKNIVVLCEPTGRFDHVISNVNTLYKVKDIFPTNTQVFLLSAINLTWLLKSDNVSNEIEIPMKLLKDKSACGLLPFGQPCRVYTEGLKWNLDNSVLEFGVLISTSNTYKSERVLVKSDHPIVWTMEIDNFLTNN